MKLKNAHMLELVPPTENPNAGGQGPDKDPLSRPVPDSVTKPQKRKQEEISDLEDSPFKPKMKQRGVTNITMNFHNVSAPITMFNSTRPSGPTFPTQPQTPFQFPLSCHVEEIPTPEEAVAFSAMEADYLRRSGVKDDVSITNSMLSIDSNDWKMVKFTQSQL
jgi:hypothetical protein